MVKRFDGYIPVDIRCWGIMLGYIRRLEVDIFGLVVDIFGSVVHILALVVDILALVVDILGLVVDNLMLKRILGHNFDDKNGLDANIPMIKRDLWGHFDAKKGLGAIFYEKFLCCNIGSVRMRNLPPIVG